MSEAANSEHSPPAAHLRVDSIVVDIVNGLRRAVNEISESGVRIGYDTPVRIRIGSADDPVCMEFTIHVDDLLQ